jgi:hypothetical protein
MGMVSLDGTWRYLAVPACVICPAAFMILCAYPHVGYYKAGHFAVSHLMFVTTHLMCIKCGDSVYLLIQTAHQDEVSPTYNEYYPCRSYKYDPYLSYSITRSPRCLAGLK